MAERRAVVRWCGGGIVELATPDYSRMVYVDAWFWSSAGWSRFGIEKPPEYASPAGLAAYVRGKNPRAVLVALTHDHNDHIGDFFETLSTLKRDGIEVRALGQADMMRAGLVDRFKAAGLDPAEVVLNGGVGANLGGVATWEGIAAWVVPAVHSNFLSYPPIGYVIEVGGVRFYASGDTDLFGDMALIGQRYHPDVALVCIGNAGNTMGPADAATAVKLLGASIAIPIHYAHNPRALGPEGGQAFAEAVRAAAPNAQVHVLTPGESVEVSLA